MKGNLRLAAALLAAMGVGSFRQSSEYVLTNKAPTVPTGNLGIRGGFSMGGAVYFPSRRQKLKNKLCRMRNERSRKGLRA